MIIRLVYLTSAFSLAAAASKSSKSSVPTVAAAKSSKSSIPDATAKSSKSEASVSISMSLPSTSKSSKSPTTAKSAKSPESALIEDAKSKSGKTMSIGTKSSKTGGYFVAPFSCPQSCITGENYELSTGTLEDAVTLCDASDEYQMWKVHVDGTFLKFESAAHYDDGMCLAVKETCSSVGLANCDDPETQWYNTGGQLLSALCWSQGTSVALSADAGCTDLEVDEVDDSTGIFLLLESDFIE
mmetsp:Transcript_18434/g.26179  ORF Transcript_18434/g.26179 Transcript_18434/m.26179 type:complete len:242 (+) Transcript_18434:108-833(+)